MKSRKSIEICLITTDGHNLGIRSISAYLRNHGYRTKLLFLDSPGKFGTKIMNQLEGILAHSDLIGLSCRPLSYASVRRLSYYLKRLNKPIIVGGPFTGLQKEKAAQEFGATCLGEGEKAILALLERMRKGKPVYDTPNFMFWKNGIISNKMRIDKTPLDKMPFYDFSCKGHYMIDERMEKIIPVLNPCQLRPAIVNRPNSIVVMTIRGCSMNCIYCLNLVNRNLGYSQIRKMSVQYVVGNLSRIVRKYPNINYVYFQDDDFFLRDTHELCKFAVLYKRNVSLPFFAYATPVTIDERKLKLLLSAGMHTLSLGIQTGSQKINNKIYSRPIQNSQVLAATNMINRYWREDMGPPIYDIIIFSPFESPSDILRTVKLLLRIKRPFLLLCHSMALFPGMPLYQRIVSDNLTVEDTMQSDLHHIHKNTGKQESYALYSLLLWCEGVWSKRMCGGLPRILIIRVIEGKFRHFLCCVPSSFLFLANRFLRWLRLKQSPTKFGDRYLHNTQQC